MSFKNNVFDPHDWKAKVYQTPAQITDAIKAFGICGKKIARVNIIGAADNLTVENLTFAAQQIQRAAGVPHEIVDSLSYEYADQTMLPCRVKVLEPAVLVFEDGSTFEFQPADEFGMKMSVNQIPADMADGLNHSNFDTSGLFSDLIGLTIQDVEVRVLQGRHTYVQRDASGVSRSCVFLFTINERCLLKVYQRHGAWYQIELHHKLSHTLGEPDSVVKVPYGKLKKICRPVRQILMTEGQDMEVHFAIAPCARTSTDDGAVPFTEEEICVRADDIQSLLLYFLEKHFCEESQYPDMNGTRQPKFEWKFEWILGHNIYTYGTVREMLAEIRTTADMLQTDFDHPELAGLREQFSVSTFAPDMDCRDLSDQDKQETIRANIGIAVDFYGRFCRRVESMLEFAPQYEQIMVATI